MQCALVVVVNLYNNIAFYILLLIPRKTTLCIATATTKTTSSEKVKFEHLKNNNKKKPQLKDRRKAQTRMYLHISVHGETPKSVGALATGNAKCAC